MRIRRRRIDLGNRGRPLPARARKCSLLRSAVDMKVTLEAAQDTLAEAIEDLKKVELLDQREHGREVSAEQKAEQDEQDEIARRRHMRS